MSENPKNELANDLQFKPIKEATPVATATVIPDGKVATPVSFLTERSPLATASDQESQPVRDPRSGAVAKGDLPVEDDKKPNTQSAPDQSITSETKSATNPAIPKKPKSATRLMIGCFGAVGGFILLILITFILIVGQTGLQDNPVFVALGIDPNNIHRFLLTLTNIIFGLLAFVTFIVAIIGMFRFSMAKKDDATSKKKGLSLFVVGAILFVMFIFGWMTLYVYLSSKVSQNKPSTQDMILTDPPKTLGLTAPLSITFDASEIPLDTRRFSVIQWEWNFGDGETGTGETVQHTYKRKGPNNGRYTATLTIVYRNKKENTEGNVVFTKDVVFDNEKVNALFTVTAVKGTIPFAVTADASESMDPDGEIVAYEWDFDGDGEYDDAKGVTASYTYEQVGSYQISLRVTDNNGEYDTEERTVDAVAPESIAAVITSENKDEIFYSGKEYTFEGGDSSSPFGDIEKYEWDFGDGSPLEKTRTVRHIFKANGQYEIYLKVTDKTGQSGEISLPITVGSAEGSPIAVVTTLPAYETDTDGKFMIKGTAPLLVQFDLGGSSDSDNNIVEYTWDFNGDGKVDEFGAVASYTYEGQGQYHVTGTVVDAKKNEGTVKILVDIAEQGLIAKLTAEPISGVRPLTVNFDASGSSYPDGKIVSYTWNFGDNTALRIGDAQISHRYDSEGMYQASVEVASSDGKRTSTSLEINVRPVSLTACFTPSVAEGPAPLTVIFNPNCSTGTIVKYVWDFGGETSRDRKPTHVFENPGNYEVTLEVSDSDNVIDRYSATIMVQEGLSPVIPD